MGHALMEQVLSHWASRRALTRHCCSWRLEGTPPDLVEYQAPLDGTKKFPHKEATSPAEAAKARVAQQCHGQTAPF